MRKISYFFFCFLPLRLPWLFYCMIFPNCFHLCVFYYIFRNDYWIGLQFEQGFGCDPCRHMTQYIATTASCRQCRATWSWQNGDAMADSNGTLLLDEWRYDEPTGGQNCGRLSTIYQSSGAWFDMDCDNEYGFICKTGDVFDLAQSCLMPRSYKDTVKSPA